MGRCSVRRAACRVQRADQGASKDTQDRQVRRGAMQNAGLILFLVLDVDDGSRLADLQSPCGGVCGCEL